MKLMIFDPHDRGHYLAYVRYVLSSARTAKQVIVVLRQGLTESVPFRQHLGAYLHDVDVDGSIQPESYGNGYKLLHDFQAACDRHQPDHIWVPSADLLVRTANIKELARRWRSAQPVERECGLVEVRFHQPPRRWRGHIRNMLERATFAVGSWYRMHTIDPTLFNWLQKRTTGALKRFSLVPDPVAPFVPVSKRVARERLEIRQGGRYIVSVGVHAIPRKGTELLVESFAAARLGANDRLLLAGPLGDRLSGRLRTDFSDLFRAGRIVVLDRYINDIEVMNVLAAADLVCTPYIGHLGSSAIVLQAMKAERPVLAPHQGWFAAMIPHFQLGTTGDILEAKKLASALVQALERSESYRLSPAAMRLTAYSDADNFGRMWARRLRERMGLPTDPALRTWDWVLGGAQFPEG